MAGCEARRVHWQITRFLYGGNGRSNVDSGGNDGTGRLTRQLHIIFNENETHNRLIDEKSLQVVTPPLTNPR
jgi:hypothetical protein